jgi:hypothetical protein
LFEHDLFGKPVPTFPDHAIVSGALVVNIEDSDLPGDKLLKLLRDNQIDLNVVEGLRLVVAFRKIRDPSDRKILIELAERLAT